MQPFFMPNMQGFAKILLLTGIAATDGIVIASNGGNGRVQEENQKNRSVHQLKVRP